MSSGITLIAEKAEVSISAVSKVLNNYSGFSISEKKRRRILQIVKKLGYQANPAARGLKSGKSGTMGIILHSVNFFSAKLISSLEKLLSAGNYSLLVSCSHCDIKKETELISQLNRRLCDALLIVSCFSGTGISLASYKKIIPENKRILFLDSDLPDHTINSITSENTQGAFIAAGLGKKAGFLKYKYIASGLGMSVLKERFDGFCRGARDAAAEFHPEKDRIKTDSAGLSDFFSLLQKRKKIFFFFESFESLPELLPLIKQSKAVHGRDFFLSGFDEPYFENPFELLSVYRESFARPVPWLKQNISSLSQAAADYLLQEQEIKTPVRIKIPLNFINFKE
ncbi:MAG: hypothetical protein A2096_14875 [Spirochaetes bacterium GWF1_41_5]|nr:MAG: hypothetical protein A2096_14875 [Spirochaetes bacterium GWF1_41_5]HBE02827.1 hypothetical protein [Spirochaetia bacterium]